MYKAALRIGIIVLIGALVAGCNLPGSGVSSNPAEGAVKTIVAGTMDAFLAATPVPSLTHTPSITPTPTMPLPVPSGWSVYWNEQFGFAFSHPNLIRCQWEAKSGGEEGILLAEFLPSKDCPLGTDAFYDTLFFGVRFNTKGLSFQEFMDQERQAPPLPWNSQDYPGRPGTYTEETIHYAGQDGVMLTGSRDGASLATAYLPFPNSQKILSFSIGTTQETNFMETGRIILSTLRFVNEPAGLAAMATQTAAVFIPPDEMSRTEYMDINELLRNAPFRLWLPSFLPEDLSLTKKWVAELSDGSQQVELIYSEPGDTADLSLQRLLITMTKTDREVSLESIYLQPGNTPKDMSSSYLPAATIHMYSLASPSVGDTAHAEWSETGINFHLTLSGNWPPQDENTCRALSCILYPIAYSMEPH